MNSGTKSNHENLARRRRRSAGLVFGLIFGAIAMPSLGLAAAKAAVRRQLLLFERWLHNVRRAPTYARLTAVSAALIPILLVYAPGASRLTGGTVARWKMERCLKAERSIFRTYIIPAAIN